MPNEKDPSDDDQKLTDEELEEVSGGTDRFDGKYLVQGVTHPSGGDSQVNKIDSFTIKQAIKP